jgi:hypothetical protein
MRQGSGRRRGKGGVERPWCWSGGKVNGLVGDW